MIGVETGSELNSEEEERKKKKKSTKKEVRVRKIQFEDKGKKGKEGQEKVDELTRKLLQLNVKDDAYAAAYAQLFVLAPEMTDNLLPPSQFGASTVAATSTTMVPSYPRYPQPTAPMLCNFSCHFCKKPECRLRTCPTAAEYVRSGRVLLKPNGYYAYLDGSLINARHPGGLKGAIDAKSNGRDTPLHLARATATSTKFSSFVEATQIEEEKLVWGVMTELESEKEEVGGLVMTRAQGRKEVEKGADKGGEGGEQQTNKSGKEKTEGIRQPAYCREPRIANVETPHQILQRMLEVEVPNIRIRDLLALSGDLQQEMMNQTHMQNRMPAVGATLTTMPRTPLEFTTPLREVEVVVMGRQRELGLLDERSEIVIVREDLCNELGLEVNRKRRMTMQTANGGKEELQGCVEYLELEVGGVKTYAHAFMVQSAPYRLLLGRPWQKGVKLGKIERADGSMEVKISDLEDERRRMLVPTKERVGGKLRNGMLVVRGKDGERQITRGGEDFLIVVLLCI